MECFGVIHFCTDNNTRRLDKVNLFVNIHTTNCQSTYKKQNILILEYREKEKSIKVACNGNGICSVIYCSRVMMRDNELNRHILII